MTEREFEAWLAARGVRADTLSAEERARLARDGYLVLANAIAPDLRETLCAAFERAAGNAVQSSGTGAAGTSRESGTRHIENFVALEPSAARLFGEPRVLAGAHQVLRKPFRTFQFGGRDPNPGYGQQGLHTDWLPRAGGEPPAVVTVLFLLDAFTKANGATRVVPASHTDPRPLTKSQRDPAARHPGERVIEAPAGSALLFDGYLLHSGTRNASTGTRRALQTQFVVHTLAPPGLQERFLVPGIAPELLALFEDPDRDPVKDPVSQPARAPADADRG